LAAPDRLADLERVAARYAVAVTPASAALIDRNDPDDPIGRQFLPDPAELEVEPGERADPVGDAVHSPLAGIVHRYRDRVLLMATHACATYCRFCFRREVVGPGKGETLTPRALAAALAYIAADPGIWEVILTGGDPLVLSPRRLGRIFEGLGQIGHVKVVRLHTRVPAVDPARISAAMIEALKRSGKAVYVALHANHPRELTPEARAACARLVDAGFPMVSQTVLLKGVNDDPAVLADLMRAFVETRIKPYYLHHGDLAPGTGRHRVALADGQALLRSIRGEVSGLCQPTFVLDIPGGFGKVPVGPCYVRDAGEGRLWIKDPSGDERLYPPPST
jgi:lysine 2,3-aminomutase